MSRSSGVRRFRMVGYFFPCPMFGVTSFKEPLPPTGYSVIGDRILERTIRVEKHETSFVFAADGVLVKTVAPITRDSDVTDGVMFYKMIQGVTEKLKTLSYKDSQFLSGVDFLTMLGPESFTKFVMTPPPEKESFKDSMPFFEIMWNHRSHLLDLIEPKLPRRITRADVQRDFELFILECMQFCAMYDLFINYLTVRVNAHAARIRNPNLSRTEIMEEVMHSMQKCFHVQDIISVQEKLLANYVADTPDNKHPFIINDNLVRYTARIMPNPREGPRSFIVKDEGHGEDQYSRLYLQVAISKHCFLLPEMKITAPSDIDMTNMTEEKWMDLMADIPMAEADWPLYMAPIVPRFVTDALTKMVVPFLYDLTEYHNWILVLTDAFQFHFRETISSGVFGQWKRALEQDKNYEDELKLEIYNYFTDRVDRLFYTSDFVGVIGMFLSLGLSHKLGLKLDGTSKFQTIHLDVVEPIYEGDRKK